MLIAIPSKGRAGKIKSHLVLSSGKIYVPDGEVDDYSNIYKNVVGVPGNVRGITKTRNWILKSTKERYVVFVDDDVKNHGWVKLFKNKVRQKKITEEVWLEEFEKYFFMCEELKYRLWGVDTVGATMGVYPYKPILFKTYVTASCCGVINDGKTHYDERFPVKEDYELNLRLIKEDGGILGIRYLFWANDHWKGDGGCKDYSTMGMERSCIRRLVKMYPGMIRQVKKGGSSYSIELNF